MDRIIKAVIFGGKARVAVLDTTQAVNKSIALHNLSPLAAAALGRTLSAGAYITNNFKSDLHKLNIIIDGGGELGKIYVSGNRQSIKGFVENPGLELPYKNGKLDVGGAVGTNGDFIVIKDLGLKEPYVGKTQLVNGEIAEDFAHYLYKSEGITSAVALGVMNDKDGCRASGGVIVEAMPDADDNIIFMLEDIMSNFKQVSAVLAEKSAEEIMEFYFGHLEAQIFDAEPIVLSCNCDERIAGIVKSIGLTEALDIIKEQDKLELHCDYCSKLHVFNEEEVKKIFGR